MAHSEDLEILQALQIAPRASWRAIGQALRRPASALAARWQEMSEDGLAWSTAVPFGAAQSGALIFVAVQSDPLKRASLIEQAVLIPEVVTIEEPARQWDLILTVRTADIDDYLRRVRPAIAALDGVTRHETIICTRLHFGGHEWRLDVLPPSACEALAEYSYSDEFAGAHARIRSDDRVLIPALFRDGRVAVSDLATELDMHPSTVSRRLNRLLNSGAISLRCDIAPELVDMAISCQWFCWLPPQHHAAAAEALRDFPELRLCASTTGQTNFTFFLWVDSPEQIFELEARIVDRIEHLSIAESSVTVRFIKRMGWRLDARGRRLGEPVQPVFF